MAGKVFLSSVGPGEAEDTFISFGTHPAPEQGKLGTRFRSSGNAGSTAVRSSISSLWSSSLSVPSLRASYGREVGLQAAPEPVTRFFFPDGAARSTGSKVNPYFRHFDVRAVENPSSLGTPYPFKVPEWAPEAFKSLAFLKVNDEKELENAPVSSEVLKLGKSMRTKYSKDSEAWTSDMQFCTWVSKLRPRAHSDGESSCELMGGVIQWLMKQLIETEKVIHDNMEGHRLKELQDAKDELWKRYHSLRLDDEKRLREKLALDCAENLKTARKEAIDLKQGEIQKLEDDKAGLRTTIDELDFEIDQLKKAMTDTHTMARKYEEQMKEEKDAKEAEQDSHTITTSQRDFLQGMVEKARAAAVERAKELRGQQLLTYCCEAIVELTAVTSAYFAKIMNLGVNDGTASKQVGLLTLENRSLANQELHYSYIAASKADRIMIGKTMLLGQGVSFDLALGAKEIDVESTFHDRNVFFFSGDSLKGSYFALPVHYLGRQMVGMLAVDSCGGEAMMDEEVHYMTGDEKEFIRNMKNALEEAIANDEQEAEERMDPMIRLQQMIGSPDESMWDKAKKELDELRDLIGDSNHFRPSDLAHLRGLGMAPPQSYQVLKAAFRLVKYDEADYEVWHEARGLLSQDFVTRMRQLGPEQCCEVISWKRCLLEVMRVDRMVVEEESMAAIIVYKWFLAMRAATAAYIAKKQKLKLGMKK